MRVCMCVWMCVCVCVCVCASARVWICMYACTYNPLPEVKSTLRVNEGHCAPLLQTWPPARESPLINKHFIRFQVFMALKMYFCLYRDFEDFVKTLRRKSSYVSEDTHTLTHTHSHTHIHTHTYTHIYIYIYTHTHSHTQTPAILSGHGGVQLVYHIIWKKANLLFHLFSFTCNKCKVEHNRVTKRPKLRYRFDGH